MPTIYLVMLQRGQLRQYGKATLSARISRQWRASCYLLFLAMISIWPQQAGAHGGVSSQDDVCLIRIGFLEAHFAIYQPQSQGSQEFCEDIPDVADSVFVMDYLHDFLKEMPVDFRILEDVNKAGVFAKWEDVVAIDDIDRHTVFYQSPSIQPGGVLTVEHKFERKGDYIGVVTAQHPSGEKTYRAVFYFQVGGSNFGYVPLIVGLVILLQILYLRTSGRLRRFGKPGAA